MAGFKDAVNYGSNEQIKNKLPLEHFAKSDSLRFFLDLFLCMKLRDSKEVPIAGVMLNNERGVDMLLNMEEFEKYPIRQQNYVLAHEGAHILLEHLLRNKRIESPEGWNIATDGVLNHILDKHYSSTMEELKDSKGQGMAVTLERLQAQKLIDPAKCNRDSLDEMTAEDAYDQLMKNAKKIKVSNGPGSGCPSCGKDMGQKPSDGSGDKNAKNGNCPHCGYDGKEGIKEMDKKRFDKHDPNVTNDNMNRDMREKLGDIMRGAKNNQYGKEAGDFARALEKAIKKYFPFDRILDKIIFRDKNDFSRPHRRMKLNPYYFPRKHSEKVKVYAAVDVSGSCMDYTEDFLGYIMALPQFEAVYFFDTGITQVLTKNDEKPEHMSSVKGGGGTDLNPVMDLFRKIERESFGAKLNFVVLTDGYIPALTTGPSRSRTVILTTGDEVHWSGAQRPYHNIKINPKD